jgi:RecA/RadA recombinase
MSLLEKIRKNSKIKESDVLSDSKFFGVGDFITTSVPMLNVAFSGSVDGGLTSGLTVFAGPSKHFKTSFALLAAGAFLKKYPEGILLFYDTEFGSPQAYFESFGIDISRVYHVPLKNIEELKFDLVGQLENFDRKDKVMIIIDSVGNIASKKEMEDAINEKSVADMSRAKALKGLFRMITPYLTMKDIPLVVINHIYMEQCFAADTKILLGDKNLKKISEISVGDMVMTRFGPREVEYVYTPEELKNNKEKMLELVFEDGLSVKCTANHRFLVGNEWKRADELILFTDEISMNDK